VKFLIVLVTISAASAQTFTEKGYLETSLFTYPQTAVGDSGHVVDESILNYEATWHPDSAFTFNAGIEAQTDTHNETERNFHVSWLDRELQRPAFAVRRLTASYHKGRLNLEAGRQLIHWGKADILNPTDRLAPRDFLNVVHSEFLPVTAARMIYGGQTDSIDLVAAPLFTPSRSPLLDQRWGGLTVDYPFINLPSRFPGGTQLAARWNHIGRAAEFSFSMFDGDNHQPLIAVSALPGIVPTLEFQRYYTRLRSYGADLALPLRWLTFKSEAAYFDSLDVTADRYLLYVTQLERQSGEWSFIGGYVGEVVTRSTPVPSFDYERGMARAFMGRVGYTISANRDLTLESVLRQNGEGFLARAEYSQAFQQHWRATVGVALIRGSASDFLGQYSRNCYVSMGLRYSL
jgi:hypothetical protein